MGEVHKGICGNHSGARSLVHKLIRARYYWPTMLKDAQAYVKACDKCQRFSNFIRQPFEELTPMTALWPFAQWELDIMGPFPTTIRQLKFLIVGIDYFTKWVEAEALATITEKIFEVLSGEILSTGMGYLECSFPTTESNSTIAHLRTSIQS